MSQSVCTETPHRQSSRGGSRGGGIAHRSGEDQFLAGVSVSGDGGYWLTYWTTQFAPLVRMKRQAIYFPPGLDWVGADVKGNVMPDKWKRILPGVLPCPSGSLACFAPGEYNTISSNPFAGACTPFVDTNYFYGPTGLSQLFLQDPPAPVRPENFKPIFYPANPLTDLAALSGQLPARESQVGQVLSGWLLVSAARSTSQQPVQDAGPK